jgi:hypothetical protein
MKRALTIAVAGAALAATLSFVAAGTTKRESAPQAVGLPVYEIIATVRAHGLAPISALALRWPYYVLHAYDPRGIEVRVVIDAQFGDIISVAPARPLATAYTPRYERGARIIQIPQTIEQDEPAATDDDDAEEVAPPVLQRTAPRPKPRSESAPVSKWRGKALPPLPVSRRNVLSAPPPPVVGAAPLQQSTRIDPKTGQDERFKSPGDLIVTPSLPPLGYTPPAALPPGYTPPAALPPAVTSNGAPLLPGYTPTAALPSVVTTNNPPLPPGYTPPAALPPEP